MKQKINALVLGIVRHSDRTDVVTLYSRQQGRISVAIPARSTTRRRSANPALMPLSVIEGEISKKTGSELWRLWSFSLSEPLNKLHIDPAKTAIGMFVAEFLAHLLREQTPDPGLWNAVMESLRILDREQNQYRIANFHIVLLWQMMTPAGIVPDINSHASDGSEQWLDMRSGRYTSIRPQHNDIVQPRYASIPLLLHRLTFRNSHCLRISGEDRYMLCEWILRYYAVHLPGMGSIRSHHILHTLFS